MTVLDKRILISALCCLMSALTLVAQVIIDGELTHEAQSPVGASYRGSITVQNIGTEERTIKIYQTDYSFSSEGTIHYGEVGTVPRSNARWISFFPERLTVPPSDTATVNYLMVLTDTETVNYLTARISVVDYLMDRKLRTFLVFSNRFRPLALARNLGLVAMDVLPPAKHSLARLAMGFAGKQPRLTRGVPL